MIGWFWEALTAKSPEQRAEVLRFATGLPSIPIGGIAELSPKFTISRGGERRFSSRCPNRYLLSCARMDAESTSCLAC